MLLITPLRGLRGLRTTAIIRVTSALNLGVRAGRRSRSRSCQNDPGPLTRDGLTCQHIEVGVEVRSKDAEALGLTFRLRFRDVGSGTTGKIHNEPKRLLVHIS